MKYRFASLVPEDEPAVTLHLLSLDEEDRALRFGSCTSDATLVEYVQSLDFNRDVAEGVWNGGRLVGFAHLAVYPEGGYPVGELGLSISRGYRGQGIAARLIRHAVLQARRFRLTTMYIHYMRRNLAMTLLVRHLGLKVVYEGDEARASLNVMPLPGGARLRAGELLDGEWTVNEVPALQGVHRVAHAAPSPRSSSFASGQYRWKNCASAQDRICEQRLRPSQ